jgi:hypothetical protein
MMKTLQATALILSLLPQFIPILPISAQEPLCYWGNNKGKEINLDSLCTHLAARDLDLIDVHYSTKTDDKGTQQYYISGQVMNSSNVIQRRISIDYKLYTRVAGNLTVAKTGSEMVSRYRRGLGPGEETAFNFQVLPSEFVLLNPKSEQYSSGTDICYASSIEGTKLCKIISLDIRKF